MSLEDLERAGVLLPREEWGTRDLDTTVNKPLLVAIGVLVVASALLMYFGNGQLYTWIGAGVYLLMLLVFLVRSLRAIEEQYERTGGAANLPGEPDGGPGTGGTEQTPSGDDGGTDRPRP